MDEQRVCRKERPVVVVASSGAGSAGDREKAGGPQVLLQKLMSMNEPEEDQGYGCWPSISLFITFCLRCMVRVPTRMYDDGVLWMY